MEVHIPGRGIYNIEHVVLDVNGTIAVGGKLLPDVREHLWSLVDQGFKVAWITADTRGLQSALDCDLGWPAVRLDPEASESEPQQKAAFVESLGSECVVAIGNGANDAEMLRHAAIGIAVLGPEGLSIEALQAADILAADILTALDLLLDPARLVATLRR